MSNKKSKMGKVAKFYSLTPKTKKLFLAMAAFEKEYDRLNTLSDEEIEKLYEVYLTNPSLRAPELFFKVIKECQKVKFQ